MPFTKFTNLDFDQIKESIKSYLRANSEFTGFDFEGSNFSVLIDTLAYNTYITAINSNMVINESFLDSATVRENVVSLARNVGYVPRSRTAAKASVNFNIATGNEDNQAIYLKAGLVCTGAQSNSTYSFSIPDDIESSLISNAASFGTSVNPITIYQGTYLSKEFIVDGSIDQRFILDNSYIDTSTIVVYINTPISSGVYRTGKGILYNKVDNILNIDKNSEIYLIQEVQDERYELLFGDGIFGKKLENGAKVTVQYIITDGKEGDGPSNFTFSGSIADANDNSLSPASAPQINTVSRASNGGDIESLDSIKYYAPRLYSAQYRAVTSRDYETIIQQIYPNTESVSVFGGEEMDPPEFGSVFLTIKPKNGDFVSDFDKNQILSDLKQYSLTGINQKILDLKVLYIEAESYIYYNSSKVESVDGLRSEVIQGLTTYSNSIDLNKFGGRFKYSKVLTVIDDISDAITSNITRIRMRRNLNALVNQFAQYELCFGNQFNVKPGGFNIKSTGFKVLGLTDTVYFTDVPDSSLKTGTVEIVREDIADGSKIVIVENAGTVDYVKGELNLTTIFITSTEKENNIIEVQAFPESNDVIGLQDLYLKFGIASSSINMVKDTITSGEQISGIGYNVTSSYNNGELTRE